MAVKKQFTVNAENKPGQLAKICRALARAKVNMEALMVAESTDLGMIRFVASSTAAARKALNEAKIPYNSRGILFNAVIFCFPVYFPRPNFIYQWSGG